MGAIGAQADKRMRVYTRACTSVRVCPSSGQAEWQLSRAHGGKGCPPPQGGPAGLSFLLYCLGGLGTTDRSPGVPRSCWSALSTCQHATIPACTPAGEPRSSQQLGCHPDPTKPSRPTPVGSLTCAAGVLLAATEPHELLHQVLGNLQVLVTVTGLGTKGVLRGAGSPRPPPSAPCSCSSGSGQGV